MGHIMRGNTGNRRQENQETGKEAQGCEPSGHSPGKEEEGNTVSCIVYCGKLW